MKVLLATGYEEFDRCICEVIEQRPSLNIEVTGEIYYRGAIREYKNDYDVIVISEDLPGEEEFTTDTLCTLREMGKRVIFIVGDRNDEDTNTKLTTCMSLGIYDFIYNDESINVVLDHILNPATLKMRDSNFKNLQNQFQGVQEKTKVQKDNECIFNDEKEDDVEFQIPKLNKLILTMKDTIEKFFKKTAKEETDFLTGCLKREAMSDTYNIPYLVLFMDLDNFKTVNDTYGHNAGDEVLRSFGHYLSETVKTQKGKAFRYGGDEFIAILENCNMNTVTDLASELMNFPAVIYEDQLLKFTVSIGIAEHGTHGENLSELIKAADQAMYQAKKSGKNSCLIASFDSPINTTSKQPKLNKKTEVISTEYIMQTAEYIKKAYKKLVVIDADKGQLASMLGVDANTAWQHDWRIGLAATPALMNKKVEIYTVPIEREKVEDWQERDIRALKDIVLKMQKEKKQVLIIASDLYESLNKTF